MYNDVTSRTNFQIANENDIEEIKNVLEYASGLIIKDSSVAEQNETMSSLRNATQYISAYKGYNDVSELQRDIIINNYNETNLYYLQLKEIYNIDIVTAREAKDLDILKTLNQTLSVEDENLFKSCYYETIEYFEKVFFTKAFQNQYYYTQYIRTLLVAMTLDKYFTRKLDNYYDIDKYSLKQIKNSFISYGYDYFDILPINYQRRILKLINEFIISKGTNADIKRILDVFGFDNIHIYKYVLTKLYKGNNWNNPYLVFFKTKVGEPINYSQDLILPYEYVTGGDPFWQASEKEVLMKNFNTITSKYMSVDVDMDSSNHVAKLSYFVSLLNNFIIFIKDNTDSFEDFAFYNRNMSSKKIDLFTALTALTSIIHKIYGLSDYINLNPDTTDRNIYGYNIQTYNNKEYFDDYISNNYSSEGYSLLNNFESKEFSLIDDIKERILSHQFESNYTTKYKDIYKFFQGYWLRHFNLSEDYMDTSYFYKEYSSNSDIQSQLNNLENYSDYVISDMLKCKEIKETDSNEKLPYTGTFAYNFFSDEERIENWSKVISQKNAGLFNFVKNPDNDIIDKLEYLQSNIKEGLIKVSILYEYCPDLASLLSKYTFYSGMYGISSNRTFVYKLLSLQPNSSNPFPDSNNSNEIDGLPYAYYEIKDYIEAVDLLDLTNMYNNDGVTNELLDYIIDYNLTRRKKIMIDNHLSSDEDLLRFIYNDEQDLSYYKELYYVLQLFYVPYKDIKDNTHTFSGFMELFEFNESLRENLLYYMNITDDYVLYRQMLELYNYTMITTYENVYDYIKKDDNPTFASIVKNKDLEFYNWMIPTEDITNDTALLKKFYNEKIVELVECIDNFIGTYDLFINHPLTSIIDNIREILYILVTIFKSYTIDLLNSNTVYKISDKIFNNVRLFDMIGSVIAVDSVISSLRLVDIYIDTITEELEENINLRDVIESITENDI